MRGNLPSWHTAISAKFPIVIHKSIPRSTCAPDVSHISHNPCDPLVTLATRDHVGMQPGRTALYEAVPE